MIQLHPPSKSLLDLKDLHRALKSGWLSSSSPETKKFESMLKAYTNAKYVISTINGTAALQLAIASLKPKKGDIILVPDVSFISTVNSIHYNFCKPIFIGINNNFLLCDKKLENFIKNETYFKAGNSYDKKSKKKILALILVNTFGNLVNVVRIKKILKGKNIKIIEDAAESLGSKYYSPSNKKKIHAGLNSNVGCISFNVNKIITTGGGGAVLTNSKKIYSLVKHLANQSKIDYVNFIHDQVGFNYALPGINSALGINQLKNMNKILQKKKKIHTNYKKKFGNINDIKFFSDEKDNYQSNYWLNLIKLKKIKNLSKVIKILEKKKISVRPIWHPLSLQPYNLKYKTYKTKDTSSIIKNVICLPSGYDLTNKEQENVVNEILKVSKREI